MGLGITIFGFWVKKCIGFGFEYNNFWILGLGFGYKNVWVLGLGFGFGFEYNDFWILGLGFGYKNVWVLGIIPNPIPKPKFFWVQTSECRLNL